MNCQRSFLIAVSLSIFALAVCHSGAPAQEPPQAPGSAALLIGESTNTPDGWIGPVTLWLDGVEWSGTGFVDGQGNIGEFTFHGTETHLYEFDGLGSFQLETVARTTFDVVESDFRWHTYVATGIITEGTGVFAEAQGLFDVDGYTRWPLDESGPPTAWFSAPARIYNLQPIPEPTGIALMTLGLLACVWMRRATE